MNSPRHVSHHLPAGFVLVTMAILAAACGDDAGGTTPGLVTSPTSVTTVDTTTRPATTTTPTTPTPTTTSTPATTATTATTLTTATTVAATSTTAVDVDLASVQATLDTWLPATDTFGVTVSIRRPGHEDIHLASGVDDRDITAIRADGSEVRHAQSPMPTDGTFPIAYITRTFVAAAALQLVDEGRITLDEPVTPWLPELPNSDQTTLRMLLGYTAGLGQWDEVEQTTTLLADLTRTFTPEEVLAKHLEAPPAGLPGSDPSFGRASYIAVGLLVQRLLDTDLATVIHSRFIAPLGLDETVFTDGAARPSRHGWLGVVPGPGDRPNDILEEPLQAVMSVLWASEAMISSSDDVLDWGEALFSGRVLGPTATATMLDMNPTSPPPVPNRYFGLGATGYCLETGCDPDAAELVGAPGGGFCCWSTQLVYDRRTGTTIVVATNTNAPQPAQLIELSKAVLAELDLP